VGKLRRYFWPKTALLFYLDGERIEAAFGYIEAGGVEIQERRTIAIEKERELGEWLEEIRRTYPKTYVSAMLDTINQRALPACSKTSFEHFGVDTSLVRSVCIDESWLVYTSLAEIKRFEQKFKGVDFDLLYSPFVLLYRRCRPLLEARPGLFALHRNGTLFLAVFSKERMWYAQILPVANGDVKEEMMDEEYDGFEEPVFDLEEIGEDVEPVGDIDMPGDFKEEFEPKEHGVEDVSALELLEYNFNLFEEIKDAIARFYHDDRYPKEFIEKVTIFDMNDLSSDLVRYIEDELFMEASLYGFDPIETMAELVAEETED
jgi:hypothetical protein